MASPERGDDQAVHVVTEGVKKGTVVSEADREDGGAGGTGGAPGVDRWSRGGTREDPDVVFRDVADRPGVRSEGERARRMSLADPAGSVNLLSEHHGTTHPSRFGAGRDAD